MMHLSKPGRTGNKKHAKVFFVIITPFQCHYFSQIGDGRSRSWQEVPFSLLPSMVFFENSSNTLAAVKDMHRDEVKNMGHYTIAIAGWGMDSLSARVPSRRRKTYKYLTTHQIRRLTDDNCSVCRAV